MVTPNIWGQGQIFAFSALDGNALATDDFSGVLSGDKVGIRFQTKIRRELAITGLAGLAPVFEAVCSDMIRIRTNAGPITILYAHPHTVIGYVSEPAAAIVLTEGIHSVQTHANLELHDTHDGQYTALLRDGSRFAFAYGSTPEAAAKKAEAGLCLDIAEITQKKLAFYEKHHLAENHPYAALYAKCVSVMKGQLYAPQGRFQQIWSTPDRLPHRHLWLWDSVFHAIGHRNLDPELAMGLILSVLDTQAADGFIPHMATVDSASAITQPPVIAWGAWLTYQKSKSKDFLKTVFQANQRFLLWCRKNRRDTDEELYTWLTQNDIHCRCDESGMDNSPRFDLATRLQAIDFSCFMANDVRYMAKIAAELGDRENEAVFSDWYQTIKTHINRKLWCAQDRFYYDYDLINGRLHKIQSVASFLPLFAGICDTEQAAALTAHLTDPESFYTPYPIPSISRKDATYGSDMWRGPVWINYNYMLISGLKEYGNDVLASEIREKTLDLLSQWYLKTGTIFEFYDPENQKSPAQLNRKGVPFEPYDFTVRYQSIRDYGWSCTLCLDLLHNP